MNESWKHCYRLRASLRNLGLFGSAFTFGMTVLSVIAWNQQPANDAVKTPFVISIFVLFTLLYVYFLLLYLRYRLFIGDSSVRQMGVFEDKLVDLSKLHELKWSRFPQGGSIRLRGNSGDLNIGLGNLEKEDGLQLVEYLRRSVSESKQIGWEKFSAQFVDTSLKQKRFAGVFKLLVAIFSVQAFAFFAIWVIGGGISFLVYSAMNAGLALYLLRRNRREMVRLGSDLLEGNHRT
jgi:hypothetical protein